jgi:hypothetical protein
VFLALVDAWYYFFHRWCHTNRTAYRLLHAKHHDPTAALNAITAGYVNPVCAALEVGVPMAVAYLLTALVTGNLWHALAGISAYFALNNYGHSGQWCSGLMNQSVVLRPDDCHRYWSRLLGRVDQMLCPASPVRHRHRPGVRQPTGPTCCHRLPTSAAVWHAAHSPVPS